MDLINEMKKNLAHLLENGGITVVASKNVLSLLIGMTATPALHHDSINFLEYYAELIKVICCPSCKDPC